ncbi:YnaM/YnfT family protein [Citrobacter freundii]|uniref:YnaM/YnfT family protein n=1 Tax=Citrobacter freundii TaxID=546 RepID=UPI000B20A31F
MIIARNLFPIQLSDNRIHLTLRSPMITSLSLVFAVITTLCIMLFAAVKVGVGLSNNPDRNDN